MMATLAQIQKMGRGSLAAEFNYRQDVNVMIGYDIQDCEESQEYVRYLNRLAQLRINANLLNACRLRLNMGKII